jgi:hypothetical protein
VRTLGLIGGVSRELTALLPPAFGTMALHALAGVDFALSGA